jgi:sialic acid synthase SpsE
MSNKNVFEDLFVLEIANNHWGSLERGYKIVEEFGKVVRQNNVKAAIKLQIRDVDNFVHKDFRNRKDIRYTNKTLATKMTKEQHAKMVEKVLEYGCIPMATAFDERSVDWAVEIGCELLKVASSDINDWFLLQKLAKAGKPVIVSTGGASLKSIDDMVKFFTSRNVPLAINHCVSNYPSEDCELELNEIDYLIERYPDLVVGHSTHEYHDWSSSMYISYAKGARMWERHVDIPYPENDERSVSKYCSLPHQIDEYFSAFYKAKEMCGGSSTKRRVVEKKEVEYLDNLVRGIYIKEKIAAGKELSVDDVYLAVPLQKGQISSREFMEGFIAKGPLDKDQPLLVTNLDSDYYQNKKVQERFFKRGL